jgi:hypothetical protein
MKKNTKIILTVVFVIAGAGVVALAAAAGGAYYIYGQFASPEQKARMEKAKIDGREFGKATDQNGCMEKGYLLAAPESTFDLSNQMFVKECLGASRPVQNFCEGVPFMLDRDWFENECKKVGHDRDACVMTYIAKRNFCRM